MLFEQQGTVMGLFSGKAIMINSIIDDFIHKKNLAQLLKQLKRDFKFNKSKTP